MGSFTYENEDRKSAFEKYEWDNVWIDNTDNKDGRRILYIGDSISCTTRRKATIMTKEEFLFDGFGTSKALDNPFFKDGIRLFTAQLPKTDAVIFNNGLHGFHLDDSSDYKKYYEEMVMFLLEHFKNKPLFLVLTTNVAREQRKERVIARNKAVTEIAEKYNLPVIDLYSASLEITDLLTKDGVHFTEEGYIALAEKIVTYLKMNL